MCLQMYFVSAAARVSSTRTRRSTRSATGSSRRSGRTTRWRPARRRRSPGSICTSGSSRAPGPAPGEGVGGWHDQEADEIRGAGPHPQGRGDLPRPLQGRARHHGGPRDRRRAANRPRGGLRSGWRAALPEALVLPSPGPGRRLFSCAGLPERP